MAEFVLALAADRGRGCRCSSAASRGAASSRSGLPYRRPGLIDGIVLLCPGLMPKVAPPFGQRVRIARARVRNPGKLFPIPLNEPELFTASPDVAEVHRRGPIRPALGDGPVPVLQLRARHLPAAGGEAGDVPVLLLLAGQDRIIDNAATRGFWRGSVGREAWP